jgi:predicted O-methyltransferase YrrM
VIYYNTGTSCAVRLLVSLHSLRQHYGGPVTILTEGEESNALCEKIGAALGAEVKRWDCGVPPGPNRPYLAKTRYHLGSPYELTVALDSDTLVVGGIDELFQLAAEHSFCVAQLAQWKTRGKIIGGRIRQWQKALPEWIQDALNFGPAINCGVVAFHKDARLCADWLDHALKGREYFIPDEVSCQLMLPRYPHHILDGCWNRSCKHDDPSLPETRIIHYHGRKHCRAELPYHGDKWAMAYDEVMRQNLAGVRTWTPAGDRQLARHMKACQKERNKPTQHSASSSPVYETELWCPRGHLNEDQADKYAEICARVRPRYVLETGFCTGRSAACVLHYSTAIERMVSIDINLDYNAQHGRRMAALLKGRFPAWDVLEESSRVILTATFFRERFPQGIDLATIDGDHSYEGCLFDLEAVSPHLTERGVMIVDDYQSGPPNGMRIESVTRSVDDFLNKHANAFVGERWYKRGKGFCIIRRI